MSTWIPSTRDRFTPPDFTFLSSVLSPGGERRHLWTLWEDPDALREMLDLKEVLRALLDSTSALSVSPAFYFYVLVRHSFLDAGITDPGMADYVAGVMLQRLASDTGDPLRSLPAGVLVIMLGTNDAVLQLDRTKALANVRAIADAWPKARLVLVAPPYWDAAAAPWLAAWSADLRKLAAERGARFVDAYAATRSNWLCHPTDRHPCEAAHREIGAMVRSAAFAP